MSVLSLEWCSPTKCQAQKQNQIVEFNTIKIEDLYFQEGEKQRDSCDAVINAVSTALGAILFWSGKPLEEAITLFKQQLNRIAHYSCESNLMSMIDFVFMALFQH